MFVCLFFQNDDDDDFYQPEEPQIKLEHFLDDSENKFEPSQSSNSSTHEAPSLPAILTQRKIIPWRKTDLVDTSTPTFTENFLNHSVTPVDNYSVSSQAVDKELVEDDLDMIFWKSISPDVKQLNPSNKRKFKLLVMTHLNNLLEQQNGDIEPKL